MKKVAVVLSGCGARDGSEIREAICLLLSLSQLGIRYECFSIDKLQAFVFDHYNDKIAEGEKRNVLIESARIACGKVKEISNLNPQDFDGLAFAGGYGTGLNLSDFALNQKEEFSVEPKIEKVILDFKSMNKPMYFLCISPVIIAKVLKGVKITLGNDKEISSKIRQLGAEVVETDINEPVYDAENKVITTPCYMLEVRLNELYNGIYKGAKDFASIL